MICRLVHFKKDVGLDDALKGASMYQVIVAESHHLLHESAQINIAFISSCGAYCLLDIEDGMGYW